ncbi:MAG: hypothetical protein ACLTQP_11005 [Faecalibacterium prausnitzii]
MQRVNSDLKDDERNALKDEMIRVIRGKSSIDRDMIQQLLDENQAAIQAAQDALTAAQNKLEEIEQENKKAENDCSNLFTWASTYQERILSAAADNPQPVHQGSPCWTGL